MSEPKSGKSRSAAKANRRISVQQFEREIAAAGEARYVLRLYVTGMTPRSQRAIASIEKLCNEHLQGRYELEIVDIYQQPERAKGDQIIAAPTLVKKLPLPLRRIIGDMSSPGNVLVSLGIKMDSK